MRAIVVEDLGKKYRLREGAASYGTLRDALGARLSGQPAPTVSEFWALRDLSFTVGDGEVLGIVGRNGAGKSTLLKMLTRITRPTTGSVVTRGRVGALLEVGTGFHGELTGRENVYLNGALLGMSRRDVTRRFDEIVAFSGVERFLDTPVKRYSSGMYLRLAFAIAAHVEPDIVIVDEVLAVGDAEFQQRCLGKMSEFEHEGRTVLFVSHDLGTLGRLCSRALWLEGGRRREDGPAGAVIEHYLEETGARHTWDPIALGHHDGGAVVLTSVQLTDGAGGVVSAPRRDEPLGIELELEVREVHPGLDLAVYVKDREGRRILDDAWSDTRPAGAGIDRVGHHVVAAHVPPLLTAGEYTLGVWIGTRFEEFLDRDVLRFDVAPGGEDPVELINRPRVVQPQVAWDVRATSSREPGRLR